MAISSNITVTADVDGEYTLADLLEMLRSPDALKKALKDLERAARKANAAMKEQKVAKDAFDAEVRQHEAAWDKDLAIIQKDKKALAAAWETLDQDKETHSENVKVARAQLRDDKRELSAYAARIDVENNEVAQARTALTRERTEMLAEIEGIKEGAAKDRVDGEKALNAAKKLAADAEVSRAKMREVLG